jgi:hypothetical protein
MGRGAGQCLEQETGFEPSTLALAGPLAIAATIHD